MGSWICIITQLIMVGAEPQVTEQTIEVTPTQAKTARFEGDVFVIDFGSREGYRAFRLGHGDSVECGPRKRR